MLPNPLHPKARYPTPKTTVSKTQSKYDSSLKYLIPESAKKLTPKIIKNQFTNSPKNIYKGKIIMTKKLLSILMIIRQW
jgi:hypothetical protein